MLTTVYGIKINPYKESHSTSPSDYASNFSEAQIHTLITDSNSNSLPLAHTISH